MAFYWENLIAFGIFMLIGTNFDVVISYLYILIVACTMFGLAFSTDGGETISMFCFHLTLVQVTLLALAYNKRDKMNNNI